MNDLPKQYFTMETYLFPMLEEEIGEITAKMKEFLLFNTRDIDCLDSIEINYRNDENGGSRTEN